MSYGDKVIARMICSNIGTYITKMIEVTQLSILLID